MKQCSFCGNNTLIAGTLHIFTTYRCEDKDYIILQEQYTGRIKGYFEILRYCPACLLKYCVGERKK